MLESTQGILIYVIEFSHMILCGWISQIQLAFGGNFELICSFDTETCTLKGRKCYVDQAYESIINRVRSKLLMFNVIILGALKKPIYLRPQPYRMNSRLPIQVQRSSHKNKVCDDLQISTD